MDEPRGQSRSGNQRTLDAKASYVLIFNAISAQDGYVLSTNGAIYCCDNAVCYRADMNSNFMSF